jgi:ADP-ribose pyrophosphatase
MERDEILAEGRHLRLVRRGRWEFVERVRVTGVVAIVAVTDSGEIVIVEQERPPVERRVIEIPAGLAGDVEGDDSLEDAARRELLEETGYSAERFERLADTPVSAGQSNEVITFFRAFGLRRVGEGGGDGSEEIETHLVPLAGAEDWLRARVREGVLVDAKVYAGLWFARCDGDPV